MIKPNGSPRVMWRYLKDDVKSIRLVIGSESSEANALTVSRSRESREEGLHMQVSICSTVSGLLLQRGQR